MTFLRHPIYSLDYMFICHWRACYLKLKLDRLNNQIDLRNFTQDEAMKVNEISWELDLECRPQSHYINENVNFQFQIYLYIRFREVDG